MSRKLIVPVLVPLLVVVHFILHVGLGIGRWAPDLLTVALLIGAREVSTGAAAGLGFGLGLLEDSFLVVAFGANTFTLTLVGALGARTRELFVGDSLRFLFLYLALGILARDLVHWLLTSQGARGTFLAAVVIHGGLGALYGAVVGTLILVPLGVSEGKQ